jgi:hypothetical protein
MLLWLLGYWTMVGGTGTASASSGADVASCDVADLSDVTNVTERRLGGFHRIWRWVQLP